MTAYGENAEEYPRLKGEYFRNPEDNRETPREQASDIREANPFKEEEEPRALTSVRKTQRGFRVKESRDKKL